MNYNPRTLKHVCLCLLSLRKETTSTMWPQNEFTADLTGRDRMSLSLSLKSCLGLRLNKFELIEPASLKAPLSGLRVLIAITIVDS